MSNMLRLGDSWWSVVGHCTKCGNPIFAREYCDSKGQVQTKAVPITTSTCKCFSGSIRDNYDPGDLET
jgi:hypothetical protein